MSCQNVKDQPKFECKPISLRKRYFDIWIDFGAMTWRGKRLLNETLLFKEQSWHSSRKSMNNLKSCFGLTDKNVISLVPNHLILTSLIFLTYFFFSKIPKKKERNKNIPVNWLRHKCVCLFSSHFFKILKNVDQYLTVWCLSKIGNVVMGHRKSISLWSRHGLLSMI